MSAASPVTTHSRTSRISRTSCPRARRRNSLWRSARRNEWAQYRLCGSYDREDINWAIRADDPEPLCVSCRLTRVIPDLGDPGNKQAWYRLELAKRRLVYSLLHLGLPFESKAVDPERGIAFELLADHRAGADGAQRRSDHDQRG